jgi:hypothetical protein
MHIAWNVLLHPLDELDEPNFVAPDLMASGHCDISAGSYPTDSFILTTATYR